MTYEQMSIGDLLGRYLYAHSEKTRAAYSDDPAVRQRDEDNADAAMKAVRDELERRCSDDEGITNE